MNSLSLFVLLCFVAFSNLFFFRSVGDYGTQLFFIGVWIFFSLLGILRGKVQKKPELFIFTCVGMFLITAFSLFRANETILQLLSGVSIFLILVTLYSVISEHPHIIALMEVVSIPLLTLQSYLNSTQKILTGRIKSEINLEGLSKTRTFAEWSRLRPILGGILLSAPIAFILLSLFAKADPVFESFIKNIVGQTFLENMIWRAVLSFVCFAIGLPVLFMHRIEEFRNPVVRLQRMQLITEFSIVMSVVATIIGIFLVIQWKYIFVPAVSGVSLSQYGIQTYSEYVNKGFTELLTASVFIFGLIWTGLIFIRGQAEEKTYILKTIQTLVLVEFVVLLFSVFRRIVLYQQFHGMSLVRFYGGYFLVFLFLMTITLFLRHFMKFKFVIAELFIAAASVFMLAFFNVERYISLYSPPKVNDRTDYVYLSRMSADGYDGWKQSYDWIKQILEKNYPEGTNISADQRREIAYAGITLEQLMSRYHELILQSGTPEEIKLYTLSINRDMLKQVDEAWIALDNLQPQLLANQQDENLWKQFREHRDMLTSDKNNLQNNIDKINKADLDQKFIIYSPESPSTSWSDPSGKIGFTNTDCSYWGICLSAGYFGERYPQSFYVMSNPSGTTLRTSTVLDDVFNWSLVKSGSFVRFSKEMPFTDLLQLQYRYFKLYQRITRQPDSEHDYEADLSMGSPFLIPVSRDPYYN